MLLSFSGGWFSLHTRVRQMQRKVARRATLTGITAAALSPMLLPRDKVNADLRELIVELQRPDRRLPGYVSEAHRELAGRLEKIISR